MGGGKPSTPGPEMDHPSKLAAPIVSTDHPITFGQLGSDVEIRCSAIGNPRPAIFWERIDEIRTDNNQKYKLSENYHRNDTIDSTLLVRSLESSDYGHYRCVAYNVLGRDHVPLGIYGPDPDIRNFSPLHQIAPLLYSQSDKIGGVRGHNVEIKCSAIGNPRPGIYWARNELKLINDWKYKISEHYFRHDTIDSTLLVRSLESSDLGEYKCVAYNSLGINFIALGIYAVG